MKLKDLQAFNFFILNKHYSYLKKEYRELEDWKKTKIYLRLNRHHLTVYALEFDTWSVPVGNPCSFGLDDEVTLVTDVPEKILNSFK